MNNNPMKHRLSYKASFVFIAALVSLVVSAQKDRTQTILKSELIGLEYEVKAGFNLGGTSPIPLPVEIREIQYFKPSMGLSIEGSVTKWIEKSRWAIRISAALENKGMNTKARVKNYGMEITGDGGEKMKGNWTGEVKTHVKNSYLTIPIQAVYKVSNRVTLNSGAYLSYLIEGAFSGTVFEGYIREGDPTGNKVVFSGDSSAPYDFSNDLQHLQYGVRLGCEWKAFSHLNVYGDLNWGLNNIFKKNFDTVTFNLYPIFLNVGFGYAF